MRRSNFWSPILRRVVALIGKSSDMVNLLLSLPGVYSLQELLTDGRVYGHVITKFSRMGRSPHFLTHGSPTAPV